MLISEARCHWASACQLPVHRQAGLRDGATVFVDGQGVAWRRHFAKRERALGFGSGRRAAMIPSLRVLLIELTVVIGVGVLLAFIGPYGSFEAPLADRLLYWIGMGVGGLLIFRPTLAAATMLARRLDLPEPATWVAGSLIATLPMSLIVWFAAPGRTPRWPSAAELLPVYANVMVLAAAVTLIFWYLKAPERAETMRPPAGSGAASDDDPAAEPRFFDRLPPHLGRELLALEMEDHYVRVHTAMGNTLLLMRMRDAVAELDGLDGYQVHRSWWIARKAVDRDLQDGRNVRLQLKNGLEAPVARSTVPALREAGWFR